MLFLKYIYTFIYFYFCAKQFLFMLRGTPLACLGGTERRGFTGVICTDRGHDQRSIFTEQLCNGRLISGYFFALSSFNPALEAGLA